MGAGNSKHKITSQDKAILDLKIQRDKLKQYQKGINVVLEKEVQAAREALKQGNKKRALLALKKKKYQEQLLERTDQQLANLEELASTHSIEYALVEKQVFEGLKTGNFVLEQIHKEMSVEDVEKLMDDTAEAIAYQNEIDEILSGQISTEDEEEILKELNELQEMEMEEQLPSVPTEALPGAEEREQAKLPPVPTHDPASTSAKEKEKGKEKQTMLAA